jgi:hypothetical protein
MAQMLGKPNHCVNLIQVPTKMSARRLLIVCRAIRFGHEVSLQNGRRLTTDCRESDQGSTKITAIWRELVRWGAREATEGNHPWNSIFEDLSASTELRFRQGDGKTSAPVLAGLNLYSNMERHYREVPNKAY